MELYLELTKDVRFKEGLKSCMNCGVCTAICPAAEFYDYDPRILTGVVQSKDEQKIEELLKSDVIWPIIIAMAKALYAKFRRNLLTKFTGSSK